MTEMTGYVIYNDATGERIAFSGLPEGDAGMRIEYVDFDISEAAASLRLYSERIRNLADRLDSSVSNGVSSGYAMEPFEEAFIRQALEQPEYQPWEARRV